MESTQKYDKLIYWNRSRPPLACYRENVTLRSSDTAVYVFFEMYQDENNTTETKGLW